MYTALRFRVQQRACGKSREDWKRWTWVHEEKHGPRCALFVGKFTPSAQRHTGNFPAAGSRQAREREPHNVFRKQCNGELAPKVGSDRRNYTQDLSETGPRLATLRMSARSPETQETRGKRDVAGDFTVNARGPQSTPLAKMITY